MSPRKRIVIFAALLIAHLAWTATAQNPEAVEPTTIVAIGDSIMKGGTNWSIQGHRNTTFGGWVTLLQDRLDEASPGRYRVINEGVDGDTALGTLVRIDQDVVAWEPDIVLLGIGTNDAFDNEIVATPSSTTNAYLDVVDEILDALQRELPDATIVLVGYATPVREYFAMGPYGWIFDDHTQDDLEENFVAYNDALEAFAEQEDLVFIDVASQWPTDLDERWELLADGLHPNDAGHALIADHVYEMLLQSVLVSDGN